MAARSFDYSRHYCKFHEETPEHAERMVVYFRHMLEAHLPADRSLRVIDVGCGMGFALLTLQRLGFQNVRGVDVSPHQVEKARRLGLNVDLAEDTAAYLHEHRGEFDLALSLDVIEHLPVDQQTDFVAAIADALAPGGTFLCTVPNANSVLAARWRYIDYTHTSAFTEHSLDFLLYHAGFDEIRVLESERRKRPRLPWLVRRASLEWAAFRYVRWRRRLEMKAELGWEEGAQIPLSLNLLAVARKRGMSAPRTFDIFDTVLVRRTGGPQSVFRLVGQAVREFTGLDPEAFAGSREEAERRARLHAPGGEVGFAAIYRELREALGWSETTADHVAFEELRIEATLLAPVPGAREELARLRAVGTRIAFVSDMYLPADYLRERLEEHGLIADGEPVIVSGERGSSKASGRLYAQVAQELGAGTHVGNCPHADVAQAKGAGWQCDFRPAGNPNRYERALERHAGATAAQSSLLAGASRLARLAVPAASDHERAIRDVAAGVVGPALIAFTLWVLRRARSRGLQTLYFVSRDGQVLLDIARRLAPALGYDGELRYLYGGRQAWHVPTLAEALDARMIAIALEPSRTLDMVTVCARLGCEPADLRASLEAAGFPESSWRAPLDMPRAKAWLELPKTQAAIRRLASGARESALRYLGQEGLFDGRRYAIVDMGWKGRLQDSLARLACAQDAPLPQGFYFGLIAGSTDPGGGPRDAFFTDARHGLGYGTTLRRVPITYCEIFCMADHGTVLGYAEREGKMTAVLKSPRNEESIAWGLPKLRETLAAYLNALDLQPEWWATAHDLRPAVRDVLEMFWAEPTPEEARAWGAYPMEDDQAAVRRYPFAEPYGLRHILLSALRRRPQWHPGCSWLWGSIELSPAPIRWAAKRLYAPLGKLRARLNG